MRCFVDTEEWEGDTWTLDREASHHLARVLRVTPGTPVTLFNGRGKTALAEVITAHKSAVEVRILEQHSSPEPCPHITLAQALIRGPKMDLVIQKSVELGVRAVWPVAVARCVARVEQAQERDRAARWTKIVHGAAEQCGLDWIPEVKPVGQWRQVMKAVPEFDLAIAGALTERAQPLPDVLTQARQCGAKRILALIGPEGDFTEDEYQEAEDAGVQPVHLGPRVLRAETAAIYICSAMQYEWQRVKDIQESKS